MKISEHLLSHEVKPKILALPSKKEIPNEVLELKENYFDKFGINNTTAKYIKDKKQELEREERQNQLDFAQNEITKNLVEAFGLFKLVSYKTMDDIAKQYNLYMSGLNSYIRPIPQENLEELDLFTDYLKEMDVSITSKLNVARNREFIFNTDNNFSLSSTSFDKLFFIMAPKSHFKKEKNQIIIGKEIHQIDAKPTFKYEFKVNQPEPKDPIIFTAIKIHNKIYCAIITAWDKVADDLRIRQLI